MMDGPDLIDFVSKAALAACGGDVKARRTALWDVAVAILADVLRQSDELGRERLLRGIEPELRASMDRLEQLMDLSPYPRITH